MPRVPCDWIGLRSSGLPTKRKQRPVLELKVDEKLVEQRGMFLETTRAVVPLSSVYEPGSPEWEYHLDQVAAVIRKRYGLNEDMLTDEESRHRGGVGKKVRRGLLCSRCYKRRPHVGRRQCVRCLKKLNRLEKLGRPPKNSPGRAEREEAPR